MASKEILGHIDCPTCGTAKGMRITSDKNGDPFGYCEAGCSQQMRVGGDKYRVQKFIARYPWAAGQPQTEPVTVTETEKPAPEKPAPAVKKPVTETAPAPEAKKRTGLGDALKYLGVE